MADTEQSINELGGIPEITMEVEAYQMVQTAVDKTLSIAEMAADAKAVGDAIGDIEASISDLSTSDGIALTAEDGSPTVYEAITGLQDDVENIGSRTGEAIPIDSGAGAPMLAALIPALYPVGAVYISTNSAMPSILTRIGEWEEIKIPASWNDIKNGTRSWETMGSGDTAGTVRFWRRTA